MMNHLVRKRPDASVALLAAGALLLQSQCLDDLPRQPIQYTGCEKATSGVDSPRAFQASTPSWVRKEVLARIGIPLPTPRILTKSDPTMKLSKRLLDRRRKDEIRMMKLLEEAPALKGDTEKLKELGERIFEVTYGKGVTAQIREDFLLRYGCTGWTDEILKTIVTLCESRGIVEMGAGHGQWARALSNLYDESHFPDEGKKKKRFDFVLAYDGKNVY